MSDIETPRVWDVRTCVLRARVTEAEKAAVQQLVPGARGESAVLRELIREGLRARGLWPPRREEGVGDDTIDG